MHNINLLLVGHPGVGKTAAVEAEYSGRLVKILLSSMVEEDIAGLPWRENFEERRTKPKFIKDLEMVAEGGEGKICLFLDEIDKARQEVADTLLTLLQSRKIWDWHLPSCCDIVAAANPPETGGGEGVSEPMLSRFAVVEFKPNPIKWAKWCNDTYPKYRRIAELVKAGEIPLFDTAGEGLEMRTLSPRTLELAMLAKTTTLASREEQISGLLPAEYCHHFLEIEDEVYSEAVNVLLKSKKQRGAKAVLRL